MAVLQAHRARQNEERLAAPEWRDADLVFPNRRAARWTTTTWDGQDLADGDSGSDSIYAGDGRDKIFAGRGSDEFIDTVDGQRDVICLGGSESGSVDSDRQDELRFNCGP